MLNRSNTKFHNFSTKTWTHLHLSFASRSKNLPTPLYNLLTYKADSVQAERDVTNLSSRTFDENIHMDPTAF